MNVQASERGHTETHALLSRVLSSLARLDGDG